MSGCFLLQGFASFLVEDDADDEAGAEADDGDADGDVMLTTLSFTSIITLECLSRSNTRNLFGGVL